MNIDVDTVLEGGRYYNYCMTPELYESTDFFRSYTREGWGDHRLIQVPLVYWLDGLRDLAGKPVNINCAYELAGHKKKGCHPLGMAADIHIKNMPVVDQLLLALKLPFNGVGVYPYWNNPGIHVDIRPLKGYKRLWWRDKVGVYHNLNSIDELYMKSAKCLEDSCPIVKMQGEIEELFLIVGKTGNGCYDMLKRIDKLEEK